MDAEMKYYGKCSFTLITWIKMEEVNDLGQVMFGNIFMRIFFYLVTRIFLYKQKFWMGPWVQPVNEFSCHYISEVI